MVERCKTAYVESRRVRVLVSLGLGVWGLLLAACSGGFPPWAWRFLFSVFSQLPHLWSSQGSAIIVPLFGLVLLSLSLLILWTMVLVAVYYVILYWWHHLHEHEHFAMDLRDAEQMAEEAMTLKNVDRQNEKYERREEREERWQPLAPVQPVQFQPVLVRQPAYTVARASRVVGASGLIRVPSAAFSDEVTFPEVVSRQSVEPRARPMAAPTQEFSLQPLKSRPSTAAPTQEFPRQTGEPRTQEMMAASTQTMSRQTGEPRMQATAAPTQEFPRQTVEPRTQLPQSMQVTQPVLRQAIVGHAEALTASSVAPQSAISITPMREQLRLVPRITEVNEHDDVYNTLPILVDERDIAARKTLPGNEVIGVGVVDRDEEDEEEGEVGEGGEAVEPFRLLVGLGLDPGIARKDMPNEDNLFAIQGMRPTSAGPEPVGLFIVADGMGGHAHGQEASKLAVQAISDVIVPTLMRQVDTDEVFPDLLKDGVHRANLAIYRQNREQEHMMGTTLTAVLVVANTAYVVNVGDSRTYLYRPGEGMRQVTRDHSIVARLAEDGVIKREDVYTHPKRNQIYRCLGERATVEVDTFVEPLRTDDVLVLCSDGLWEMVHDDELEGIIASSATYPSQMSKMLIQAALLRGGADNISVIVACIA